MNPQRTGPSLRTLAVLGIAVLALHLGLLAGEVSLKGGEASLAPVATPASASARGAPPAVVVTRVRQVAATPPAAPSSQPVARPAPAKKTPAPRPPTPQAAVPEPQPGPEPVPGVVAAQAAATDSPAEATPPAAPTADTLMAEAPAATPASATPATPAAAETALPASELPPSVTLAYDVVGQARSYTYHASGTLEWRLEAQVYDARMELSMLFLGSRVQTSRGRVGPEGLRPERFADKRSSERATHFDREAARIRFSNNAPPEPLLPGAQDRLSLFMQLAGLLRARTYQEGDAITFQVAGVSDAEPWRFEVGALETLDLPAGALQARRLTRSPRKPHDSTVEVWLAPTLGHLPVRLRVAQANGDVADQRLARLP